VADKRILVTGGTGYIGSHCVVALIEQGYQVVIADNLINSSVEVLNRIAVITGVKPDFAQIDVADLSALTPLFEQYQFDAVIHFAGLKAVGESVAKPLYYYQSNLQSTMTLLQVMEAHQVTKLVFSSSATVYGPINPVPYTENMPTSATNPYGQTKLMIEQMLMDCALSNPDWRFASLRYFNPVGAHESATMGEDPQGIPNNLVPYIAQVAVGKRDQLSVFGNDYATPDGTGVRDYIHITDLVDGHIKALNFLSEDNNKSKGFTAINLGTGEGTSVLELISAFEQASGKPVPYTVVGRRAGDIATCYADTHLAKELLNWQAQKDIKQMCLDTWNWQKNNPNGYK